MLKATRLISEGEHVFAAASPGNARSLRVLRRACTSSLGAVEQWPGGVAQAAWTTKAHSTDDQGSPLYLSHS